MPVRLPSPEHHCWYILPPAALWSKNLLDTDKTLETFLTGCVEAGPEDCAFWAPTPEEINNNLTALYDSLRARPLPIKTDQTYGVLEYGHLKAFVLAALYVPTALLFTVAALFWTLLHLIAERDAELSHKLTH